MFVSRVSIQFSLLLAICACAGSFRQTSAQVLKKDDLTFRKNTYTDKQGNNMPYRLFVPADYEPSQKYPLIFWLHGANGRGSDNRKQISGGNENGTHVWTTPPNQAQLPAFVLAPQCPEDRFCSEPETNEISPQLQMALDILASVQREFSIDPDRIYIAGQSMGGLGVWALVQSQPDRWAAALVLCAFDNFRNQKAIARVPLWVFQGDADMVVPVDLVRQMVKDLKKSGVQPRYSEYHNAGHDVWLKAFAEPDLVPWLAAQKRK
ncbi:MAG: phospholipase [Acidobacteria bacterium]|nr:MAG: phospholipase [Acidobacteriota bacterium]